MTDIVAEIGESFATSGAEPFGEGVSAPEHCPQSAAPARREGAEEALVVAALLHDAGKTGGLEAAPCTADRDLFAVARPVRVRPCCRCSAAWSSLLVEEQEHR